MTVMGFVIFNTDLIGKVVRYLHKHFYRGDWDLPNESSIWTFHK